MSYPHLVACLQFCHLKIQLFCFSMHIIPPIIPPSACRVDNHEIHNAIEIAIFIKSMILIRNKFENILRIMLLNIKQGRYLLYCIYLRMY